MSTYHKRKTSRVLLPCAKRLRPSRQTTKPQQSIAVTLGNQGAKADTYTERDPGFKQYCNRMFAARVLACESGKVTSAAKSTASCLVLDAATGQTTQTLLDRVPGIRINVPNPHPAVVSALRHKFRGQSLVHIEQARASTFLRTQNPSFRVDHVYLDSCGHYSTMVDPLLATSRPAAQQALREVNMLLWHRLRGVCYDDQSTAKKSPVATKRKSVWAMTVKLGRAKTRSRRTTSLQNQIRHETKTVEAGRRRVDMGREAQLLSAFTQLCLHHNIQISSQHPIDMERSGDMLFICCTLETF